MQFEILTGYKCYIGVNSPSARRVRLELREFSGYSRDGRRKLLFGEVLA